MDGGGGTAGDDAPCTDRMTTRSVCLRVLMAVLAGCGAARSGTSATPVSPGTSLEGAPGPDPGSPPAPEGDVRALVTEVLAPQLCPRLLGSFLGLPGEGEARGPAAGT